MTGMKGQVRLRTQLVVAIATTLAMSGYAQAQTAKEQELEARIEQLERLVRELTKPAQPAAPAAAPSTPDIQAKSITPNAAPGTRFSYSGYLKLDGLLSDYDDGEIAD